MPSKYFFEGAKLIDPNSKYGGKIPVVSFVDDNSITMTPRPQSTTREIFAAAAKEMEHWKKLLQTTGGDLATEKCTVTLMKWKWSSKYGFPSLMTKNEAPGTIELREKKNDNIHTTQLRRLEINESA